MNPSSSKPQTRGHIELAKLTASNAEIAATLGGKVTREHVRQWRGGSVPRPDAREAFRRLYAIPVRAWLERGELADTTPIGPPPPAVPQSRNPDRENEDDETGDDLDGMPLERLRGLADKLEEEVDLAHGSEKATVARALATILERIDRMNTALGVNTRDEELEQARATTTLLREHTVRTWDLLVALAPGVALAIKAAAINGDLPDRINVTTEPGPLGMLGRMPPEHATACRSLARLITELDAVAPGSEAERERTSNLANFIAYARRRHLGISTTKEPIQ